MTAAFVEHSAQHVRAIFEEMRDHRGHKRERLHRTFLRMIELGYWNPGDRLPADKDLAGELPVSLATVQAAMQMLAEQNLIRRARRSGTYVRDLESLSTELMFFRFRSPQTKKFLKSRSLRARAEQIAGQGPWSEFLGDRPHYLRIERLVCVDDQFRLFSEFVLADPAFDALLDLDEDRLKEAPILQYIQIRFRRPATSFEWTISQTNLNAGLASAISLPQDAMAQEYCVFVRTVDRAPLAFHRFYVPPNQAALVIDSGFRK